MLLYYKHSWSEQIVCDPNTREKKHGVTSAIATNAVTDNSVTICAKNDDATTAKMDDDATTTMKNGGDIKSVDGPGRHQPSQPPAWLSTIRWRQ
jgi:hypothetical protein